MSIRNLVVRYVREAASFSGLTAITAHVLWTEY